MHASQACDPGSNPGSRIAFCSGPFWTGTAMFILYFFYFLYKFLYAVYKS